MRLILVFALLPVIAQAQPAPEAAPSNPTHPTVLGGASDGSQDAAARDRLVRDLAQADMTLSRLGTLAIGRGSVPAVIEHGRTVRDDAEHDLDLLRRAAGDTTLPKTLDPAHEAALGSLRDLHGTRFDDRYLSLIRTWGGMASHLLQDEARSGRDQALMFYAQRQLPVQQSHVDEAKDLSDRAPGGAKGPPPALVEPELEHNLDARDAARLRHP